MSVQTSNEGTYNHDWLLQEEDEVGRYSRENTKVTIGQAVKKGQLLEFTDAGKTEVSPLVGTAATNGFAGISLNDVEVSTELVEIAVIARHARVVFEKLQFPVGAPQGDLDFAKTLLAAAGIVLAESV